MRGCTRVQLYRRSGVRADGAVVNGGVFYVLVRNTKVRFHVNAPLK